MDDIVDIGQFAATLGLNQIKGEVFYGRRAGFPVGLKIIDPIGAPLLLFQVRHTTNDGAPEIGRIQYDPEIKDLIAAKKLQVEFDDKMAWVTFVEGAQHIGDDSVPRLLDSVLGSFAAAGLVRDSSVCHYCERQTVETLSCIDGKVAQICPACLGEKICAPENRPMAPTDGAVSMAAMGPLAAVVGAAGWAGCWIAHDYVFDLSHAETIYVPRLLQVMIMVIMAIATGGPVGYVLKKVRRRGQKLTIGIGVLCTTGAVVLGEVIYLAWIIYHHFQVFSLSIAWKILPKVEFEGDGFSSLMRLITAVAAVVLACEMAKPPKPRLKL